MDSNRVLLVGNAKIAGLTADLKMVGLDYNVAVTLFYIPYTLLEVPSNVVLKLMRPSRWISIILFCWGLVMTYTGSRRASGSVADETLV